MSSVFALQGLVMTVVTLGLFAVKAFALIDAVTRPPETFDAADKWTKTGWLILLGIFVLAHMIFWSPLSLLNIIGTIAAFVYVVDVRPAVSQYSRRR